MGIRFSPDQARLPLQNIFETSLKGWIEEYLLWNHLSQPQFAEIVGLAPKTIKNIMSGNDYRNGTVAKIATSMFPKDEEQQSTFISAFGKLKYATLAIKNTPSIQKHTINDHHQSGKRTLIIPPPPLEVVGRDHDIHIIRERLMQRENRTSSSTPRQLFLSGLPGVGKSTLTALTAHDPVLAGSFGDGVLWTALGPDPDVLAQLKSWGRLLNIPSMQGVDTIDESSYVLRNELADRSFLIIVDDVWDIQWAQTFLVGGRQCAHLFSTRITEIATRAAQTPSEHHHVRVLAPDEALLLLKSIIPNIVDSHPQAATDLVRELEYLPLAIRVAGHLLREDANVIGIADIHNLLMSLHDGQRVLSGPLPSDSLDVERASSPSITMLLQRSTERLNPEERVCFAKLGVFAVKPAKFTLKAVQGIWKVQDPLAIVRVLLRRGLIESDGTQEFQIHALLAAHARTML